MRSYRLSPHVALPRGAGSSTVTYRALLVIATVRDRIAVSIPSPDLSHPLTIFLGFLPFPSNRTPPTPGTLRTFPCSAPAKKSLLGPVLYVAERHRRVPIPLPNQRARTRRTNGLFLFPSSACTISQIQRPRLRPQSVDLLRQMSSSTTSSQSCRQKSSNSRCGGPTSACPLDGFPWIGFLCT